MASFASGDDTPPRTVRVWDPVVRLFHWTVVTACVLNLFILRPGKLYHRYVGYVVIAAVLIRLVWGFVGSRHARFADFFPTPGRLIPYLRDLLAGRDQRHIGHNPAAAVMMLGLMALLLATAASASARVPTASSRQPASCTASPSSSVRRGLSSTRSRRIRRASFP